MSDTFTCANCKGTFKKAWTDEERDAEYRQNHPNMERDNEPVMSVCDDCFQILEARARDIGKWCVLHTLSIEEGARYMARRYLSGHKAAPPHCRACHERINQRFRELTDGIVPEGSS